jgi:hypothetical protein
LGTGHFLLGGKAAHSSGPSRWCANWRSSATGADDLKDRSIFSTKEQSDLLNIFPKKEQ